MTCVNADEPSNPTPLLDIVTPVPCVSVNFFDTDIENKSLVESPPSTAAFEPN